MRFVAEILLEKLHNQVLVAMAKSFAQMTHAMYSFLKRSASSFSSILCFFRGGRYTSLLAIDSADTAICSFDISYRLLNFLYNWNTNYHGNSIVPVPDYSKNRSFGTRPVNTFSPTSEKISSSKWHHHTFLFPCNIFQHHFLFSIIKLPQFDHIIWQYATFNYIQFYIHVKKVDWKVNRKISTTQSYIISCRIHISSFFFIGWLVV